MRLWAPEGRIMSYLSVWKLRLWNIRGIDKYILNCTELRLIPPGTIHLAVVMTRNLLGPLSASIKWVQWFLPCLRGQNCDNLYTYRSSWTVSLGIPRGGEARHRWFKMGYPCNRYLTQYEDKKTKEISSYLLPHLLNKTLNWENLILLYFLFLLHFPLIFTL